MKRNDLPSVSIPFTIAYKSVSFMKVIRTVLIETNIRLEGDISFTIYHLLFTRTYGAIAKDVRGGYAIKSRRL